MSKYNNTRINTPDGWFDSKKELARWTQLRLLERAGGIANLRRQVEYELVPKMGPLRRIVYRADFVYEQKGKRVVEDTKGYRDRVYRLKARLMLWLHNIPILES